MRDWDHDGDEDYWDDVFYYENIERYYHEGENEDTFAIDYEDDDEVEVNSGGYTSSRNTVSSNTGSPSYKYNPAKQSTGVPFIVRLIIVAVIASLIGAFNEILGTIVVLVWGYIEFFYR